MRIENRLTPNALLKPHLLSGDITVELEIFDRRLNCAGFAINK